MTLTQTEKERKFTGIAGIGLTVLLVILAALGILPYITCIALILFVTISLFLVDRYIEDTHEAD